MASEGSRESAPATERVARGFEDLVDEESLLPGGVGPVPASGTVLVPEPRPVTPDTMAQDFMRVDALEYRVRVTMDRLTELVEAQLPEAVDGLRADFEHLRTDLEATLAQAGEVLAEERRQLRSQIATTVGAANRWFVRTRDQLYERLDQVAQVAIEAHEAATVAQEAAAAAQASATAAAESASASATLALHQATAFEPAPEVGQRVAEAAPVEEQPLGEFAPGDPPYGEAEGADLEWEVDEEFYEPPIAAQEEVYQQAEEQPLGDVYELADAQVDEIEFPAAGEDAGVAPTALDEPQLEAVLHPLRVDIQELQAEIAAMGEAIVEVSAEVERLVLRIPARGPVARLTPSQIEAIALAVQAAIPRPRRVAAPRKAVATRKAAGTRSVAGTRKVVGTRKAATSGKATTAKRAVDGRAAATKKSIRSTTTTRAPRR